MAKEKKEKMGVRITFRSEIYFEGKDLADIANQWEQIELFSSDANNARACEIELVSVEDADTYEDLKSEFNQIYL